MDAMQKLSLEESADIFKQKSAELFEKVKEENKKIVLSSDNLREVKQMIDLAIAEKREEEIQIEFEKSEVHTMFVAVVSCLIKDGKESEAANLNRDFSNVPENHIVMKIQLLEPYADYLED